MDNINIPTVPGDSFDMDSYAALALYFYHYWYNMLDAAARGRVTAHGSEDTIEVAVTADCLRQAGLDEPLDTFCRYAENVAADLDPDGAGQGLVGVTRTPTGAVIRVDRCLLLDLFVDAGTVRPL